ncbi:tripartite tricarboxylate transporter TctB family protein [Oceanispirochaeta sp.]|uniref:tripartite tricarboxylate transporter TctB family protein n=1 Tax=Oceanispirochaeta sp. TaxID=2035350 RepID=UPI00260D4CE3|nr:tripartite tricarboxylate transporter TctB family protein [Oceanispirochaeta sp.]MDA3956085.1 tripartite tricarboxylate transporter TctB family protein [Oceanispirochaeta sp.]
MEEQKLRQYDFLTAAFLILFGIWELFETFKMPMTDSYGGVETVWYVSPALFPLFIGAALILLGFILLRNSIKTGGAADFIHAMKSIGKSRISNKSVRVLTVLLALVSFVYILIPYIDFFMSITLFLFFLCTAFYPDHDEFRKRFVKHYLVGIGIILILLITGLSGVLNSILKYNMDILSLIFLIYLNIVARKMAKGFEIPKKLIRQVTIISLVVPLILCPLFRYFLLVPLPVEGGIIKLMNLVYYTIR